MEVGGTSEKQSTPFHRRPLKPFILEREVKFCDGLIHLVIHIATDAAAAVVDGIPIVDGDCSVKIGEGLADLILGYIRPTPVTVCRCQATIQLDGLTAFSIAPSTSPFSLNLYAVQSATALFLSALDLWEGEEIQIM